MKFIILLFIGAIICWGFALEPQSQEPNTKAALGKMLFSEKILSLDSSVSCASCHKPEFAFSDTSAFSSGIGGRLTSRNTPSVLNMKNRPYFFWDGRASTLQQQALMPIENINEMALPIDEALKRLNGSTKYKRLFQKIFKQPATQQNLGFAIAAYESTLETTNSKFDDWSNDIGKLTAAEERGRVLFVGDKAKCFDCHSEEDFTDDGYKNIGLFNGSTLNDVGLYNITKKEEDKGKFKTPGLRNIAVTAPYMHNGMFTTLEEVVEYYDDPKKIVPNALGIDASLNKPLGLTKQEKKDLVTFLKTLTDKKFKKRATL